VTPAFPDYIREVVHGQTLAGKETYNADKSPFLPCQLSTAVRQTSHRFLPTMTKRKASAISDSALGSDSEHSEIAQPPQKKRQRFQ
jgi:hypothetical protein